MDSIFKTPSKVSSTQVLPSSNSSSPFTPKRSRIKRKIFDDSDSVSKVLVFDDSNSHSPVDRRIVYSSFSQQSSVPCENTCINIEQTTPVKTQQTIVGNEKSAVNILLSPSIKRRPKRFNITKQENNFICASASIQSGSNNSTPSKKLKSIQNCKLITQYFKPVQKSLVLTNDIGHNFSTAENKSNGENMNSTICIKSESITDTIESSKIEVSTQVSTNRHLNVMSKNNKITKKDCTEEKVTPKKGKNGINHQLPTNNSDKLQNGKNKSSRSKGKESPCSNKNNTNFLNYNEQVTPSKNATVSDNILRSPQILDYLENKVNISGGDTYSRFIKFIVLKPELFFFGKSNIMIKIEDSSDDDLKIYGRLLARKHGWIRFDGPDGLQKYKESNICKDFNGVLMSLATKQLINTGKNTHFLFINYYT